VVGGLIAPLVPELQSYDHCSLACLSCLCAARLPDF
jgi:hypothetical protein